MKKTMLVLAACCAMACHTPCRGAAIINGGQTRIAQTLTPYEKTKLCIKNLRLRLSTGFTMKDSLLLQRYFVQVVTDSIIPYWYGTAWNFNGTTQTPPKGTIACGYFVSTVLRDAGLPLNRVKMGQMSSEGISYALTEKKDTKIFYDKPLAETIAWLRQQGPALYIVGLDCHVGFILVDERGCWFIHSKWFGEKCVVKEDATLSNILYYARYRMLAKISNSKKLLQAWLFGGRL